MGDFFRIEETVQQKAKESSIDIKLIIGVVLILISMGVSIISGIVTLGDIYSLSDNATYSAGYLLAPVIIILLLSSLILLTGKNKRGRNFLIFSILALLLSFSNLSTSINQAREEAQKEKVAIDKMVSIFRDFISQKKITKEDITKEKYGKSADLIGVIQENYIAFEEIRNENNSIADIMNDTSNFSSQTLMDSNKIKEKIERLEQTSKDIMALDNKIKEFMDKFKYDLSNVYISKNAKEEIMAELEESFFSSTETSTRSLKLMNAIILSMKNMITFLDGKKGAFEVKNEQILFYEDADVREYNELFELYNKAIAENNWHYQHTLENVEKKIKELEESAK